MKTLLLLLALQGQGQKNFDQAQSGPTQTVQHYDWMWISPQEIDKLPMSGPGWADVYDDALSLGQIDLANQDDDNDSYVMAAAMVWRKTGIESFRADVQARLLESMESENGGRTLALGRNLTACVIAAQLIKWDPVYEEDNYKNWLRGVIRERLDGRTIISTHEDRPNNWGTHAGAARIAVDIYTRDTEDLKRAIFVLEGWLGDRSKYTGFDWGDLCWQSDPSAPVGINPKNSFISSLDVDGVLPDDQRRCGCPTSLCETNYVYEAMQGILTSAVILNRVGINLWSSSDNAILRAYLWLDEINTQPPQGDDLWQGNIVNAIYGINIAHGTGHGKAVGYTEWTWR